MTSALDLVDGLFQLSFQLQRTLLQIAGRHRLSLAQVRLLGILRDREPGMLALARHLAVKKSSLSGLVDRAALRGLVERVASSEDGRAANVRLTAKGRRLSRVVEDEVRTAVADLVRGIPRADRNQLAELVRRVLVSAA